MEELKTLNKFNTKDLVIYYSALGKCFGEVIKYTDENNLDIRLLCWIDGNINLNNILIDDQSVINVKEDQLDFAERKLEKVIREIKEKLSNLEDLRDRRD